MADNDLVAVHRAPEPTLEPPSPASPEHHHHHDEEGDNAQQQNQQASPSAAAFVSALPADSLTDDDDDDDAFQEFAIAPSPLPSPLVPAPLGPMPVERGVHEEEAPKEGQEEEGHGEECGLHLSGDVAALADQRESPLRKKEGLAAFADVHGEQGFQALETLSSAPPAPVVCPHVGQKEKEEEEEKEIHVPLPHMGLSSSREDGGDEAAAESSLAATEEKAGALLSFNPDLFLADMQFQPKMTWEEGGDGVPSLSPPGTLPLSAIEEQAAAFLTGTMMTQDEAPETSSKDLLDDDDDFGEFATLPAENAAAVPEAQAETEKEGGEGHDALTLELKGIAAAAPLPSLLPAPLPSAMIEEEDVDDDEDDDFGDFEAAEAEFVSCVAASPLPAPDTASLLPPTPPSTAPPAPHQQASSSSSGLPSPLPSSGPLKLDARALFEECFGGGTVPVLSVTKRRGALQELRMVDLQQGLCLNRPFQAGARPWSWSDDVLAKALRPSGSCTAHRRRHQKQQSQKEEEGGRGEEEEEEEEENAISIAWAIASPAPSRFNSISQGHVIEDDEDESEKKANIGKGADENEDEDEDEEEEEEEVMDEGFGRGSVLPAGTANQAMEVTPAVSNFSPSVPSELDFDFLSGGGGGGGGKEENGWMPQQPQQIDGSPEGSALSRAFLEMGLGLPGEEASNSSTPSPAIVKRSTATSRASIVPNKAPLSEEAQAVLSEAALPDFSYMLAKLPVAPALTGVRASSASSNPSNKNN